MLYLSTDNNLHSRFAWSYNASNTSRFNLLLIYLCVILNFKTKSCDTVINRSQVLFTANTLKNDTCYFGKVVIAQYYLCFIFVIILSTRSLKVLFCV